MSQSALSQWRNDEITKLLVDILEKSLTEIQENWVGCAYVEGTAEPQMRGQARAIKTVLEIITENEPVGGLYAALASRSDKESTH